MQRKRIVILGGGFGGLTLSRELEPLVRSARADVTLLDRNADFRMGFSMQWVLSGRRKSAEGTRPYSSLRSKGVQFIQDEAVFIQAGEKRVHAKSRRLEYDYLIIALGAELVPERVPGLAEAAYNLFDFGSVLQFKSALLNFRSGTILLAVASTPFKCPPAPYEYALLIDEVLKKRKTRKDVRLILSSPEAQPMPVAGPLIGETVKKMLAERRVEYLPLHKPKLVEFPNRKALYENGAEIEFDLLAAVPPHRAPKVVVEAGLADDSGFVPVELETFKTAAPGVYAIGDAAALRLPNGNPHPKAGVFSEAQARALASQITAKITGRPAAPYSGKGACFVDVGGGRAAPAEAELLLPEGPRFTMSPPSRAGLLAKRRFETERFKNWFGK